MTGNPYPRTMWLLALLTLLVTGSAGAQQVPTMDMQLRSFPFHYEFDATIEAVHHATVASRIAAEVIEINFDVDDRVPQDAVILRFRDEEFRARLAQAEASLMAERAQYQEALARQKEAAAEARRISDLFDRKQVTRSALDKAIADRDASNARVSVLSALVKAREAQVEEAQVQMSYTIVRAPYAGVVTERLIEVGEMASPGQLLMKGVSLDQMRAVANVPQRLAREVAGADRARLQTLDGDWITAEKITLVPEADSQSRTFDMRVELPPGVEALYPGSMVKLRFEKGVQQLPVVPKHAVVQRSEVTGVYLLQDDRVIFRQIRPGRALDEEWIEVLAGLDLGERVVTDPVLALAMLKAQRDE